MHIYNEPMSVKVHVDSCKFLTESDLLIVFKKNVLSIDGILLSKSV